MTTHKDLPSAARLLAVSACALALAAPGAQAEDSQPLSQRMMQMIGLGGGDSTAKPAAPAEIPAPREAPTDPSTLPPPIPGTNVVIVDPPFSSQNRVLHMLGLGGGGSPQSAGEKKPPTGLEACPDFLIDGAGAEMRMPANAPASEVAYQIAISRMARECALHGDEISVRVGVLGAAMLGAAGKPGGYYSSVRIALRRKKDNQLFGAKTYRIGGAIPAGASRADFTLLADDLEAPYVSAKADEDYEVLIGFVKGGATAPDGGPEKPKRKSRSH